VRSGLGRVSGMDELITWLRAQLDDDERWARAASQAYTYAAVRGVPDTGVHWTWVVGEDWEPVKPDPAIDEFVAPPGENCNLATVEQWRVAPYGIPNERERFMPQTYANSIVEMDASAAGHITRWDPARVLAEIETKRRILDLWGYSDAHAEFPDYDGGHATALEDVITALAQPYAGRPGFREERRP
jgi:Family of unknown function (DUF6221)